MGTIGIPDAIHLLQLERDDVDAGQVDREMPGCQGRGMGFAMTGLTMLKYEIGNEKGFMEFHPAVENDPQEALNAALKRLILREYMVVKDYQVPKMLDVRNDECAFARFDVMNSNELVLALQIMIYYLSSDFEMWISLYPVVSRIELPSGLHDRVLDSLASYERGIDYQRELDVYPESFIADTEFVS